MTISDPLLPPPDPDPADEAQIDGDPDAPGWVGRDEVNDALPMPAGTPSATVTADGLNGEAPD